MSRLRSIAVLGLLVLLEANTSRAAEPTKQECVAADDDAQDLRRLGKLRRAREKLSTCAAPSCPALVRDDCLTRLAEVDAAMPHVVFEAKDTQGNDLGDVTVTMDGAPLVKTLDGASVAVDPGRHVFVFRTMGLPTVTKVFLLAEHDQSRREVIVLGTGRPRPPPVVVQAPPPVVAPAPPPVVVQAPPSAAPSDRGTLRLAGLISGSVGLVGLIVGGVFSVKTGSAYAQQRADCAAPMVCPNHSLAESDHATMETDSTIATVTFVAGSALLAAGVAMYLLGTGLGTGPSVAVGSGVSPGGASVSLRGTF